MQEGQKKVTNWDWGRGSARFPDLADCCCYQQQGNLFVGVCLKAKLNLFVFVFDGLNLPFSKSPKPQYPKPTIVSITTPQNMKDNLPQVMILVIVPIILVFPSRSKMVSPSFTNSGRYLKLNLTSPLSSFLSTCSFPQISSNTTVCWMVPQCRTPQYLGLMVVAWWSTCIYAQKEVTGSGLSLLSTTTMPLRMSFRTSFQVALVDFRQRQASSPAQAYVLLTLFTCKDFIVTALKFFSLSGPKRQVLLMLQAPLLMMPETTRPTPSTKKFQLTSNSKGCLMASSILCCCFSIFQINCTKVSMPCLVTLETEKMGQIFPVGINSAVLVSSFSEVFSLTSKGNLFSSLCLSILLSQSTVSSYLFCGHMSTLVSTTKNGILRNRHSPICSFVIFWIPMFAPTTTHPKSGVSPVSPLIVVLRYFSCPHRSTSVAILQLSPTMSLQYLFLFWLKRQGIICLPYLVKPMISCPIELVRPDYCSWMQFSTRTRAPPFPSSAIPFVSTETSVDFPASTLPIIPIFMSFYGFWSCYQCMRVTIQISVLQKNWELFDYQGTRMLQKVNS